MKPRVLLSCLFAAYGVYMFVTTLFAVAALLIGTRSGPLQWTQHALLYLIPLAAGAALVAAARALGGWTARFAGVGEDVHWELRLSAEEMLAVLLAAIGAFFVIKEGAMLVRGAILMLGSEAGGQQLAWESGAALGNKSQLLAHAAAVIAGAALAKVCRPLARMLLRTSTAAGSEASR